MLGARRPGVGRVPGPVGGGEGRYVGLPAVFGYARPMADELGTTQLLSIPAANAAERQRARLAEGATLREIYAEQVAAGEPVGG